jgi:hypothetical protein
MFDTDAEIEAYIAELPRGLDEFRELIGTGRIAGVRQERGRDYLRRRDARNNAEIERRHLQVAERAAAAAETSAHEAARQSKLAAVSAKIAVASCVVAAIVGIATIVVACLHH